MIANIALTHYHFNAIGNHVYTGILFSADP